MQTVKRLVKGMFGITTLGLASFIGYHQVFSFSELIYIKNERNEFLASKLLPINYRPTFYLPTCFSQMLFSVYCRKPEGDFDYKRQYIETDDGGVISLEWPIYKEDEQTDKLLVVLHGLTGDASDAYIKEILLKFTKLKGYKIVALQYRGVSNTPLFTSTSFHCGFTADCSFAMKYLRELFPEKKCYVIGCSMGANIFTKLFAEEPELGEYVKGFVSLSNPLNCYEIERRNRHGPIDKFLLNQQKAYLTRHKEMLSKRPDINIDEILKVNNYIDFDNLYTVKIFGFESAEDYYRKTSSMEDLNKLNIPSLLLNAKDDLLSPVETIDFSKVRNNPNIMMILTSFGGHLCWFSGIYNVESWHLKKVVTFVEELDKYVTLNDSQKNTNTLVKEDHLNKNHNRNQQALI